MDAPQPPARRRRRRATAAQGPPQAPPPQAVAPPPQATEPARQAQRKAPAKRSDPDRALRDLVGSGTSQLGLSAALRARDVNRPTDEDLAAAERDTVIVRRHWKPPSAP